MKVVGGTHPKTNQKYDKLSAETALKLLTAAIRNDRFHEGALVDAFESGDFPKIINRLSQLRPDKNLPILGNL